jgi:hypothetical protein
MYGHIEKPRHIAAHLDILREIQKETGGFTEFVPLGFIHERNLLYNLLGSRPGPSMEEDLRIIAVSRLFLRPWIKNVQVSWVKMGHKLGQMALSAGANDFGGTLMEESISRESGADFGENTPAEEFRRPDPRARPGPGRADDALWRRAALRGSGPRPAVAGAAEDGGALGARALAQDARGRAGDRCPRPAAASAASASAGRPVAVARA